MAVKSVIEVEVNDDAFKRFAELYAKYHEQVKELPGDWGKVETGVAGVGVMFGEMTAALLTQQQMLHEQEKAQKKLEVSEKRQLDLEKQRRREVHAIWQDSVAIAKRIGDATLDLFKWVGAGTVLSGLMGAGGLWGLDVLAGRVGDARRSAQGLGVTTAQQQAANVNFQRYVDVNPALEGIAGAQSDISKWGNFNILGVNRQQDPATLLSQLLIKAKTLYEQGHNVEQDPVVRALGVMGISLEDMRRLHRVGMEELRRAEGGYRGDVGAFGRSDAMSRKWQDFSVQMDRAGKTIENVFIEALTPLIPELTHLSEGMAYAIKVFGKSDALKHWIDLLAEGLKQVADYVTSPQFHKDVAAFMMDLHTFTDDFGQLLDWTHRRLVDLGILNPTPAEAAHNEGLLDDPFNATRWIGNMLKTPAELAADAAARQRDQGASSAPRGFASTRRDQAALGWFHNFGGWTREQAAGIVSNLHAEGFNPMAYGHGEEAKGGRSEAYGIGQWHAARQQEYTRHFGHTMQSVTDAHQAMIEQMRFVQYELTRGMYKRVGDALHGKQTAFAAGSYLSENYEAPKDRVGESIRRGGAAQVLITISNQTGAHVATQTNQLPQ